MDRETIDGHLYRGHTILTEKGELHRSTTILCTTKESFGLFVGCVNDKTIKCGRYLLETPLFRNSMQRIHDILLPLNVNMLDIIYEDSIFTNTFLYTLGNILIQIALVDVIKELGMDNQYLTGEFTGELVCAYAYGTISLKEAILLTLCIAEFLSKISTNGCPTRCQELSKYRSKLEKDLKQVICKPRTWGSNGEVKPFSAESLTNLVSNAFVPCIPMGDFIVQLGSSSFQGKANGRLIHLTDADDFVSFLCAIARIHNLGHTLHLDKLYPPVEWPVSASTAMISPLIKWEHYENWIFPKPGFSVFLQNGQHFITVDINRLEWNFIKGHVVDGRNLVPATAYILMIWETVALINHQQIEQMSISFENLQIHQAVLVSRKDKAVFQISVNVQTGNFEIQHRHQCIVSGSYCTLKYDIEHTDKVISLKEDHGEGWLTEKDIYKILKLCGYHFSYGAFRGVKGVSIRDRVGYLTWEGNWIAFMDSMLQFTGLLLGNIPKNPFVPVQIERVAIHAESHLKYIKQVDEKRVPVYASKETKTIRSGGIEITGVIAKLLRRRKFTHKPLLESYRFIPFRAKLPLDLAVRISVQIFQENCSDLNARVVEIIENTLATDPIASIVYETLNDLPYGSCEIRILSTLDLNIPNITIDSTTSAADLRGVSLLITSNVLQKPEVLQNALLSIGESGMLLSREYLNSEINLLASKAKLNVICVYETNSEKIALLRKIAKVPQTNLINISDNNDDLEWLPKLQQSLEDFDDVLIYSQNNEISGLLGFFNCLKLEYGIKLKAFLILDKSPVFDVNNEFYSEQLKNCLTVNVFKNGTWGSYRHTLLQESTTISHQYSIGKFTSIGDFSSFRWVQGNNDVEGDIPQLPINVHYLALNFKEVMIASGLYSIVSRDGKNCVQKNGFEYSGKDCCGNRYMGLSSTCPYSTALLSTPTLLLPIPNHWSLEEAATVPCVYFTAIYSLIWIGKIRKGQSILIHAGAGGVGQAALNIATHYKCKIFVTVGNASKKEYILKTFPQVSADHIASSRDTSFEHMILKHTNGRGVDFVLNSLVGEKLNASLRCLAPGGKFLDIGIMDALENSKLKFEAFSGKCSFHGIVGANIINSNEIDSVLAVTDCINRGVMNGIVKPLHHTIFNSDKVESAFQYMSKAEHIGKVLVQIRKDESENAMFDVTPRVFCQAKMSYIIIGGLGGFGLKLTHWLIKRGAKHIVLTSRTGIQTGYQNMLIRNWTNRGVTIVVSTTDATKKEGCFDVVKQAQSLGPVDGVFNLAVVLKDALLKNQNQENFISVLKPKAEITRCLDLVTREFCPNLRYFVVFSSGVSGIGNVGQTNYGLASSIIERICEKRKHEGYPALAIQWGVVGDVGIVADMLEDNTRTNIGDIGVQPIKSCLNVLDSLLTQEETIVSSMVIAKEKNQHGITSSLEDIVETILGISDLKTVSRHSTLLDLGLDSIGSSTLKNMLETKFDLRFSMKQLRTMTLAELEDLLTGKPITEEITEDVYDEEQDMPELLSWFENLETENNVSTVSFNRVPNLLSQDSTGPFLFLIPGFDGTDKIFKTVENKVNAHTFAIQFPNNNPDSTIPSTAELALPVIMDQLQTRQPFIILGYSYGGLIAMELSAMLEEKGFFGTLLLVDTYFTLPQTIYEQYPTMNVESVFQTIVACGLLKSVLPWKVLENILSELIAFNTLDERLNLLLTKAIRNEQYSEELKENIFHGLLERVQSVTQYTPTYDQVKSKVKLIKCDKTVSILMKLDNNDIQNCCKYPVEEFVLEGSQLTIFKNPKFVEIINNTLTEIFYNG